MPPARVVAVAPGSPAASTGIQPGDEVLALNGEAVRDVIRYQLQADEPVVELEVRRGGLEQLAVAEKPAGAPLDLERVVTEKLGPLYVSIHATDPDVRTRLLRNRRGATSLRWLGALLDAGVEVHGQVVVCPGINDGAVLDDTLL